MTRLLLIAAALLSLSGGADARQTDTVMIDQTTGSPTYGESASPGYAQCQLTALTFANVDVRTETAGDAECDRLLSVLTGGVGSFADCQVKNNQGQLQAQLRLRQIVQAGTFAGALATLQNVIAEGGLLLDRALALQVNNNGQCK